ncbi:uncharacterized protein LOC105787357 [Gossypium raimondii]|uniref:DUF4228 domain protein n=1 Tax=Gossypium raimondii TaxID=29730 RepID=A0A0D2NS61_GOSRA|nr:uncharacterized protein LOC105787357 [Gossypium raimondii]KJB16618.1 hypothetical protein B456_002G239800 [Gossypium raimondii]MBA0581384.1 hypothetical protein [Gossypium raimondii]
MGNCLVLEEKVVRVMKTDGKILEYRRPIKVQQVLSDFSDHALSESFSACRNLHPDTKLLPGMLYYLVPSPSIKSKKKKVRFSSTPEVKDDEEGSHGVVRIKLIISKKELEKLVQKDGVSVHEMVSKIQSKQSINGVDDDDDGDDDSCRKWKPALESIAEVN